MNTNELEKWAVDEVSKIIPSPDKGMEFRLGVPNLPLIAIVRTARFVEEQSKRTFWAWEFHRLEASVFHPFSAPNPSPELRTNQMPAP